MRIASRVHWLPLLFITASVTLSGCTTGKFASRMDHLAFWKKSSDDAVVSPPSRSFEAKTELASSTSGAGKLVPPSAKSAPIQPKALAASVPAKKSQPIRKPYTFESETRNRNAALGFADSKPASTIDPDAIDVAKMPGMSDQKSSGFDLPKVKADALTSKPYQPAGESGSFALPREKTYSTMTPKTEYSKQAAPKGMVASMPNSPTTVKNPYVKNSASPAVSPISTSDGGTGANPGKLTGFNDYSKTDFGEFSPRTGGTATKSEESITKMSAPLQSATSPGPDANSTTSNPLMPREEGASTGHSGGLPDSLKQVQGSYTPGSIKPPEPISFGAGGFTAPQSSNDSGSESTANPVSRTSGFQMK